MRCRFVLRALSSGGENILFDEFGRGHAGFPVSPVADLTGVRYGCDFEGPFPFGSQLMWKGVWLLSDQDIFAYFEWVYAVRLRGVRYILLGDLAAGGEGLHLPFQMILGVGVAVIRMCPQVAVSRETEVFPRQELSRCESVRFVGGGVERQLYRGQGIFPPHLGRF